MRRAVCGGLQWTAVSIETYNRQHMKEPFNAGDLGLLSYRSDQLLSGLVGESKCIFISFSFPIILRMCEVCYSVKLV